jgi:hypothetical protein
LEGLNLLEKAIKRLRDFPSIRKFSGEHAEVLKKIYKLNKIEKDVVEQHQKKILAEMGYLIDFTYLN